MGISATQLRDNLNGLCLEVATVGDVAEAVGKIASKSMADIGDTALTSAQKIAVMQSKLTDIKTELGERLTPTVIYLGDVLLSAFDGAKAAIDNLKGSWDKFIKFLGLQAKSTEESRRNQLNLNKAFALGLFETRQYVDENGKLTDSQFEVLSNNYDLVTSFNSVTEAAASVKKGTSKLDEGLKENTKTVEKLSDKALELKATLAGINNIDFSGDRMQQGEQEALIPNFSEEGEFEDFVGNLKRGKEAQEALNEQMQIGQGFALGFGQAVQSSLASALEGSGNFFEMMGQYLLKLAIQLATAAAAAFVLSQLLPGIGGIAGANALKGLGGFGGLFGQLSGTGIGGGGGFGGGSKIFGRDIELSNSRTNTFNSRTTGIGG